jgi:hypothetical protein
MNKKYELKNYEGHVLLVASQILLGSLLLVNRDGNDISIYLIYRYLYKYRYINFDISNHISIVLNISKN